MSLIIQIHAMVRDGLMESRKLVSHREGGKKWLTAQSLCICAFILMTAIEPLSNEDSKPDNVIKKVRVC